MYIKFITKPMFNTPPLAAGMVYLPPLVLTIKNINKDEIDIYDIQMNIYHMHAQGKNWCWASCVEAADGLTRPEGTHRLPQGKIAQDMGKGYEGGYPEDTLIQRNWVFLNIKGKTAT